MSERVPSGLTNGPLYNGLKTFTNDISVFPVDLKDEVRDTHPHFPILSPGIKIGEKTFSAVQKV